MLSKGPGRVPLWWLYLGGIEFAVDEVASLRVRGLHLCHYDEKFGCSRYSCLTGNSITRAWQLTLLNVATFPYLASSTCGLMSMAAAPPLPKQR